MISMAPTVVAEEVEETSTLATVTVETVVVVVSEEVVAEAVVDAEVAMKATRTIASEVPTAVTVVREPCVFPISLTPKTGTRLLR